jgi:hypothetical protein
MHVRVCTACGEEYRPEIARCSDCGGVLEDRHDGEAPAAKVETVAGDDPPHDARALLWAADARDLVPHADRLTAEGIDVRIAARDRATDERHPGFELRVRDADRPAASRLVKPLIDAAPGPTLLEAIPLGADPEASGAGACPACGAQVVWTAADCPECGLALHDAKD